MEGCRDPVLTAEDGEEDGGRRVKDAVGISVLMASIHWETIAWETCTRVLRQLYPDTEQHAVSYIRRVYDRREAEVKARWDLPGSFSYPFVPSDASHCACCSSL